MSLSAVFIFVILCYRQHVLREGSFEVLIRRWSKYSGGNLPLNSCGGLECCLGA